MFSYIEKKKLGTRLKVSNEESFKLICGLKSFVQLK